MELPHAGKPERIELDVIGNRMAVPMVHNNAAPSSLRYLSAQQGCCCYTRGAVSHLGRSLIFTGYGGAGKTTTTGCCWLVEAQIGLHMGMITYFSVLVR